MRAKDFHDSHHKIEAIKAPNARKSRKIIRNASRTASHRVKEYTSDHIIAETGSEASNLNPKSKSQNADRIDRQKSEL